MSEPGPSKAHDLLGLKPVGEAIKIITEGGVRQAEIFLTLICQPFAKELGLLFKDEIKAWRTANLITIANKAEQKVKEKTDGSDVRAHPRVVTQIVELGSLADDDEVQEMWAGLMASACTEDGEDDSNLVFVQLLGQLTAQQAKLIKYLCENSKLYQDETAWLFAEMGRWNFRDLPSAFGYDDANRFRTESAHLRQLGLIEIHFSRNDPTVFRCGPTALALDLYVKAQGSRDSMTNYYKNQQPLMNNDQIIEYPNNNAKLSEIETDHLKEELEQPRASFSISIKPEFLAVTVNNAGLVPIHESEVTLITQYGEISFAFNFFVENGLRRSLFSGETCEWLLPFNYVHPILNQPIKQLISNLDPDAYWITLIAQGKEVARLESVKWRSFFLHHI